MLTDKQRERLAVGAGAWGIALSQAALDRFSRFATMLEETNRQFNLTRVAPEEFDTLHFLDSLALAAVPDVPMAGHLLDVGTGAGFPGLPLAIAFPDLRVTLLDATRKRLAFVESVIASLELTNAATRHGRAEELARLPEHRGRYSLVTARAVAKLPVLAGWMMPFVEPGGVAIAYKSHEVSAEIEEARTELRDLGAQVIQQTNIGLPGTDIRRTLVVLARSGPGKPRPTSSPTDRRKQARRRE